MPPAASPRYFHGLTCPEDGDQVFEVVNGINGDGKLGQPSGLS